MSSSKSEFQQPLDKTQFMHPKYWGTWLGLGVLRLITLLPWAWQRGIAHLIGQLLYVFAKRRRQIADINIQMCFQSLNRGAQRQLLKQTLYENALGIIETGHAFWSTDEKLKNIATFSGLDKLHEALKEGKGVIMVGAHYTTLDMGGRLFAQFHPLNVLYRPHKNKLFDQMLLKARARWAQGIIDNKSTREIIRTLRRNQVFWYPADQDYGPENSIFVPFFGFQAASLNSTARLAKLTGASVFVLGHHRVDQSFRYEFHLTRVEPQPEDAQALTLAVNQLLEAEIRRYPAQYMWVHRRFKTRPNGQPQIYPS